MGNLHVRTFTSEHAPVGTSRLRIAGRPFLQALWESEGRPPVMGEAAPLEGYGVDDFSRAQADLGRLTAKELEEVARCTSGAFRTEQEGLLAGEHSALGVVSAWSREIASPSARYCAEMLVLGAVAGSRGVPLWRLLASECVAPALRTSAVVDPLSPGWLLGFEALYSRGIRTFKFKCGRDFEREKQAVLQAARAPDVRLRLDPNGGFSFTDAARFLAELPRKFIEWVEDPTSHTSEFAKLRAQSEIPLALDEPLARGLSQAQASLVAPDVVVLKPMALGGFSACVELAEWARGSQIAVCVSHLFDGNVAMSATIQLAFAVQSPQFAAGLGDHAALSSDPSGAPRALGFSADSLACPTANGIGGFPAVTS